MLNQSYLKHMEELIPDVQPSIEVREYYRERQMANVIRPHLPDKPNFMIRFNYPGCTIRTCVRAKNKEHAKALAEVNLRYTIPLKTNRDKLGDIKSVDVYRVKWW